MACRPDFVRMLLPMQQGGDRDGGTNEQLVRRLKRKYAITECGPLFAEPWPATAEVDAAHGGKGRAFNGFPCHLRLCLLATPQSVPSQQA